MGERNLNANPGQFLEISGESPKPIIRGPLRKEPNPWINVGLFILTVITTTLAGGPSYSIALLAILLSHEFGHYFLARKHHIKATLPYFIPAPPPPFFLLGTFGALIKIRSPFYDRRALFDVGIAGPLAGAIVAIPFTIAGLYLSEVKVVIHAPYQLYLGSSLLFSFLSEITLGHIPAGYDIYLHPMALAGWAGLLVTSLNLIPVGQLDGGHIAYALLGGTRQRKLSYMFIPTLLVLGVLGWTEEILTLLGVKEFPMLSVLGALGWKGWFVWVVLLMIMVRIGHPAPINPYIPLDRTRKILGWVALILFILTFTPAPLTIT